MLPTYGLFFGGANGAVDLWLVFLEIPPLNLAGFITGYLKDREKQKTTALTQAAPLISMGKTSSFVAHEMKNISISIHGFTKLLRRRGDLSGDLSRLGHIIEGESQRMERLAKDMLSFSNRQVLKKERIDLGRFLEDILLISKEWANERGIGFKWGIQKELPSLWLDVDQMKEVLINLAQNAMQATPRGGQIILKASKNYGSVCIQVYDTGRGIPPGYRNKIFRPFFTTKEEGTGLGLAISKRIVEAHGATIEFDSPRGKGSQFTIVFPEAEEKDRAGRIAEDGLRLRGDSVETR